MPSNDSPSTPAPVRRASYTDEQPPPFGHPLLKYYSIDPGYTNVNNGSLGSLPVPVAQACKAIQDEVEGNADKFVRIEYESRWMHTCHRVAEVIGARGDECVLVPNTTHGIWTVLRNLEWKKGDFILKTSITYIGVERSTVYISDIHPGVTVKRANIRPPYTHEHIFETFKAELHQIQSTPEYVALTEQGHRPRIVVIVDAISSTPGLRMPWERVVKYCKTQDNVLSVVDGAHAIGQIVGINLSETQPDFWASTCSKWMSAKRACAVLYVPLRNQHMIKSSTPTSNNYVSPDEYAKDPTLPKPPNFQKQFSWTGSHDPTAYLSIGPAIDYRKWLGGEEKINKYCRGLAIKGGLRMAEILGTQIIDETPNHELTLNMVTVKLPLPETPKAAVRDEIEQFFKEKLLLEWKVFGVPFYHNDSWWARGSAQVWNDVSDFEYLARAYKELCVHVKNRIIDGNGDLRGGYASALLKYPCAKL